VDQEVSPVEPPSPRAQVLIDQIRGIESLPVEPEPLIEPDEDSPEALLKRIFPDVEGLTVEEFNQVIDADPEAFLDDLIARGRTDDTDILLEALGLDEQTIHNLFRFGDIPESGQVHFFSEEVDDQLFRREGTLTPDGIVSQDGVQVGVVDFSTGEFKSIKKIRQEMIPTDEETRRILRIGQVPEDEIEKIIAQSKLDMTSEDWLEEYKKINPSFRKDFTYATLGRSIAAGLGDVLQAGGGIAGWADQEKWRENLLDAGEVLQSTAPPTVPYTTLGETIGNPQFWMTTAPRTATLSVVAMVPILLGAAAGAPIAGVVGLGATGTAIMTLLFGATAGALPEAALESGSAWNEAKRLGFSDEEADKAAGSVYWKNSALLFGANAIGFGLPFAKVPGTVIPRMMSKGLVKPIIVGGKLVGTSLTEGGQEFFQDIITRTALGQEVKWDDEAKMAVLLGTILGGVTGGGLVVFDTIMSRTKVQFTPEQQTVFDEQKKLQLDDGAIDAAAELRAMDFMVESFEDVKTNLEGNVEQVNREEAAKLIETEDRAEDLALEHVISQEEFGVTEVAPVTQVPLGAEVTHPTLVAETEQINQQLETETDPDVIKQLSRRKQDIVIVQDILNQGISSLDSQEAITEAQGLSDVPLQQIRVTEPVVPEVDPVIQEAVTKAQIEGQEITVEEVVASSMNETIPPETIVETTPDTVDDMPVVHDLNVIDRFRPARFVFEKMGLFDIWESTFAAETLRAEEQVAFNKELQKHAKNVKDPARRELVWEHVNNSKSDVFKQLTFPEKQAANWWKRTADDWADRLNIPPERRIKDYIPHIFDDAAKQAGDVPVDSSLSMAFSKKITDKVKMPFLEIRLGKELGLIKDPFLAAQAYQNVALRKFYYEPILQKLKLVAEHKTTPEFARNYLKAYSQRMTGEPATIDREINKFLQDVAGTLRKVTRRIPQTGVQRIDVTAERLIGLLENGNPSAMSAYNLTSALYVMWLGFKPTTAIRNLSQHGLIIAEVDNIQDFGNGIRLRFTQEGKAALAESLVVRSRRGAFIESIDSSVTAKTTDAFRETALFLFRKADEQNVKDAFLSGYAEAKRLFPEVGRDIWIKRGDEVAMDTQYLYTKMNSLAIAQSGPGKVGAMLTTWAINWLELMNKFVQGKESRVYLALEKQPIDLVKTPGGKFELPKKNWLKTRQSIIVYMAIVGLAYFLKEQDWNRVRTFEYTGFTSIQTFANLVGGEFPGLELPGAVADLIVGVTLQDERKTKTAWNTLRRSFSILNQVEAVASGEKDWLSLLFYLEAKNHQVRKLKEDWQKNWKPYDDLSDPLVREKEFPTLNRNTAQKRWREQNPLIEAQMFITNRLGTLSSDEARAEVLRLIDKHNIDTDVITGYEKIFGVDTTTELAKSQKKIGNLEEVEIGQEAKYFTVGNFLTEANEAVRINGRDKVERDGHPLTVFLLGEQDSWQPYEDYDNQDARRLYRQLNPDVEASLYLTGKIQAFENPESAKILLQTMDKFNIPPQAVNAFNQDPDKYDELFTPKFKLETKNFDLTTQFDELETDEEQDKFRVDNTKWVADMRRIEAIIKDVPESLQDSYVDYYTLPVLGFDQERFLRDNEDYYNEVWLGILGNQEINFDGIPTVEFEGKFVEYEKQELGADRYAFRGEDLEFDAEGVRLGKWKPFEERKVKPKAEVEPRPKKKEPLSTPSSLEELQRKREELKNR